MGESSVAVGNRPTSTEKGRLLSRDIMEHTMHQFSMKFVEYEGFDH